MVFRAMIPVPGSGAAREPFFGAGVQGAVMDCVLVQWFESVHCTVRAPAWSCAAGISGAENGPGGCSPAWPAGDEPCWALMVAAAVAGECMAWVAVMTCMPKIPAMRARTAVNRPARRRNAIAGACAGAVMTVLLSCGGLPVSRLPALRQGR